MEFKVELVGFKEILDTFDPQKVRAATNRAIKRIGDQTRTQAARMLRTEYNIPYSELTRNLWVDFYTTSTGAQAVITGRGRGLALAKFAAKQEGVAVSKKAGFRYTRRSKTEGAGRRGGKVTVEVRSGDRKEVLSQPPAFMAMMKSGHIGVFQRVGQARYPIRQLFGPGVAAMLGSGTRVQSLTDFVNEKFWPIFKHELAWRLSK